MGLARCVRTCKCAQNNYVAREKEKQTEHEGTKRYPVAKKLIKLGLFFV